MAENFPGYFSFVQGESTSEQYHELVEGKPLYEIFQHAMYGNAIENHQFYRVGVNRMVDQIHRLIGGDELRKKDWIPCFYYFYNRQFFVQMTLMPQPMKDLRETQEEGVSLKKVYIPLARSDQHFEMQADILTILRAQNDQNFHMPFLVVLVETFTRFVWAFPVQITSSAVVLAGVKYALSRPGISNQFFEAIRDRVTTFTVDGGSEFKDKFSEGIAGGPHTFFPNATLYVSDAKNKTSGRVTSTGAVEAAIRSLRRALRDQEVAVHPKFYAKQQGNDTPQAGLTNAIAAYNQTPQTTTLAKSSPDEMARKIVNGEDTSDWANRMDEKRNVALQKLRNQQAVGGRYFINRPGMGYAYRLYIPPDSFAKEVNYRVSYKTYYISGRSQESILKVNLRNTENPADTESDILMGQLVLVKFPVEYGPAPVGDRIRNYFYKQYDNNILQPTTLAQVRKPFQVTPTILNAIGGAHGQPVAVPELNQRVNDLHDHMVLHNNIMQDQLNQVLQANQELDQRQGLQPPPLQDQQRQDPEVDLALRRGTRNRRAPEYLRY